MVTAVAVAIAGVISAATYQASDSGRTAHPPTTTTSSTLPRSTGPVVSVRDGSVSLTLPAGWRGADVANGTQGVGAQLFPDDPSAAALIEQRLTVLPRAVLIFGVRPPSEDTRFADNVNVLPDPTAPVRLGLERIGGLEAKSLRVFAKVTDEGIVDLGSRRTYRIVYRNDAVAMGVAYIIEGTQDTWVLTYTFGAKGQRNLDLAQSSAASFVTP
jgi:hypothetical protein